MGKVRFGLKNVHYAIYDEIKKTYGEWKPLPGAVQLTADPQGDTSTFYADDIAFYISNTNSGETGTIEIASLSDEALMDLLGYEIDATTGLTYEPTDAKHQTVALGYEISGNEEQQRGVRYNLTFSRPSQESNTKSDSAEPDTVSLDYTAVGRDFEIDGEMRNVLKAHCDNSGSTHKSYDNFFKSVITPGTALAA